MSALSRELYDEIPTRGCHEMWNNGALFAETAWKIFFQRIVMYTQQAAFIFGYGSN